MQSLVSPPNRIPQNEIVGHARPFMSDREQQHPTGSRQRFKSIDRGSPHNNQNESYEYIPTAIVIKNIPFEVKRELLLDIFAHLNLAVPTALNYHLDNGVFRGLAFANFKTPEETTEALNAIRNVEIGGRKLRVEYKKPLSYERPETIQYRSQIEQVDRSEAPLSQDPDYIDPNDPNVKALFEQIAEFYSDPTRSALIYPSTLNSFQRRIIHIIANRFSLYNYSEGNGSERHVRVSKVDPAIISSITNSQKKPQPRRYQSPRSNGTDSSIKSTSPESKSPPQRYVSRNLKKSSDSGALKPLRAPTLPDLANNFAKRIASRPTPA